MEISENCLTWRCRPEIAAFADSIFDRSWSFPPTESMNSRTTEHDGVFLVRPADVNEYIAQFKPQCLRHSVSSGKAFELDFRNFKVAKGTEYDRILIAPTSSIEDFIKKGTSLMPIPAASLYVAVTRAAQSVAIIMANPGISTLPVWEP